MVTTEPLNFIPVLLGTDSNVYGMARSFHEAYGVKSVAVGKARLSATSDSRIVTVEAVEPNLEEDAVFLRHAHSLCRALSRQGAAAGALRG